MKKTKILCKSPVQDDFLSYSVDPHSMQQEQHSPHTAYMKV